MARSPTTRVHMSPSCVHHYSAPPTARPTLIEDAEPKKGDGPAQAIMAIMLLREGFKTLSHGKCP